jgi:hypothetical protein
MGVMADDPSVEAAYRFLRGHTTADLRFDEHLRPVRYVFGPDGRLIMPAMFAMLDSMDTVLFVPEYADECMEVQVTMNRLDADGPDGALTDRWRIYHGDPPDVHWARLDIDAARYEQRVMDGDALMRPNPLAADEGRLCREINRQHRDDLAAVCRHVVEADVDEPLLVGIDPLGFDVRRRFDVVRVPAPEPMAGTTDVERIFRQLTTEAAAP